VNFLVLVDNKFNSFIGILVPIKQKFCPMIFHRDAMDVEGGLQESKTSCHVDSSIGYI
jgi:hypothetical protein